MGKMISAKMEAQQKAEEHAATELHQDSRSIKSILNDHDEQTDMHVDEYDAADREITFRAPVQEREGGKPALASPPPLQDYKKGPSCVAFEKFLVLENQSFYTL